MRVCVYRWPRFAHENQRTMWYDNYSPSSKALWLIRLSSIPLQFGEVTHMYICTWTCTVVHHFIWHTWKKLRLSTRHLDSNTNLYARIEEAPQYSVHKYIYQKPLISKPSTLPALWADSLICGHKGQLSGKQLGRYQKLIAHVLISHLHNSIWCPTCMGNGQ